MFLKKPRIKCIFVLENAPTSKKLLSQPLNFPTAKSKSPHSSSHFSRRAWIEYSQYVLHATHAAWCTGSLLYDQIFIIKSGRPSARKVSRLNFYSFDVVFAFFFFFFKFKKLFLFAKKEIPVWNFYLVQNQNIRWDINSKGWVVQ